MPQNMNENIDQLIKKYLQAETTLEEESKLRQYFDSENIPEQYKEYREVFRAFREESEVKLRPAKKRMPLCKNRSRRIIRMIPYSGVAAAVLACALTFSGRNYARIDGKKTRKTEIIEQYAGAKFDKVETLLSGCLNPLDKLHKVTKGNEISRKTFEDLKKTIHNIYHNLLIKVKHEKINDSSSVPLPDGNNNKCTNA